METTRTTGFLLGLVVALSVLFVAFQWTSDESDYDIDEDFLDEMAEELVVNQWENEPELLPVPELVVQPVVPEQIKVVEKLPELPDNVEPPLLAQTAIEVEKFVPDEPEPLPQEPSAADDEPLSVRIVEQLPEFPGGMTAFVQWLTRNLKYPEAARSQKLQGRVVLSFIVNKDGSVSQVKVARSVNPLLDREALRVIRMMPPWKPGIQNNEPCRTMIAVPIVFQL
ncbi:MAG: energy transducer TonB [Prevotella sp.]|nr:energy transducer TonB [Prevotella sp.]